MIPQIQIARYRVIDDDANALLRHHAVEAGGIVGENLKILHAPSGVGDLGDRVCGGEAPDFLRVDLRRETEVIGSDRRPGDRRWRQRDRRIARDSLVRDVALATDSAPTMTATVTSNE